MEKSIKMEFGQFWFELPSAGAGELVLVLDALSSDPTVEERVRHLANAITDRLPCHREVHVAFWGQSRLYKPREALIGGLRFWREQARHLRTFSPVACAQPTWRDSPPQFVFFSSGAIHDLDDWIGSPQLSDACLVPIAGSPSRPMSLPLVPPEEEALLRQVDNPVVSLAVASPELLPIIWDAKRWAWTGEGLVSRPNLPGNTLSSPSVLSFWGPRNPNVVEPVSEVHFRDGSRGTRVLRLRPPPVPEVVVWSLFSPRDADIVKQCLVQGTYLCPVCHRTHGARQLICLAGDGLGTRVLQSVPEAVRTIVVREQANGFEWRSQEAFGVGAGEEALVMTDEAAWRYRWQAGRWHREGMDKPIFYCLPDGEEHLVRF